MAVTYSSPCQIFFSRVWEWRHPPPPPPPKPNHSSTARAQSYGWNRTPTFICYLWSLVTCAQGSPLIMITGCNNSWRDVTSYRFRDAKVSTLVRVVLSTRLFPCEREMCGQRSVSAQTLAGGHEVKRSQTSLR